MSREEEPVMSEGAVRLGDKIHVITRRLFADDLRRHFVGQVESTSGDMARVVGYTFVYNSGRNEYERRKELRTRVFGLADAGLIVNVLPAEVDLVALHYAVVDDRLALTDGASYLLDINEFGPRA